MFRTVFLIACFLSVLTTSSHAVTEVVIYGDANYKPYSYSDEEGNIQGVYADIMYQIFQEMPDYNVRIEPISWKRGLDALQRAAIFALFPPYYSDERSTWMEFSDPILAERVVVFGTKEKLAGKLKWPEDFYGATVGLNTGFGLDTMGGKLFKEAAERGDVYVNMAVDNETNLKKLSNGRIDFYINDRLIDISAFPLISKGVTVSENNGYLSFIKDAQVFPCRDDFIAQFNSALKVVQDKSVIEAILAKYTQ